MHTVSILISTRNRAGHLRDTLHSMEHLDVPRLTRVELIVVDNGSTDATPEVVSSFRHPDIPCRLLTEPRPSKSLAMNRALQAATGDVLLFTDDDVRVPPDWVARMAAPIQNGGADAVAGGVYLADALRRDWMQPFHRSILADSEWNEMQHVRRFIGANFAVARRVFDVIPGFDPDLGPGRDATGLHEETLLTRQMKEAGLHIARRFEIKIEHHPDGARLSHAAFAAIMVKQGRSDAYIAYHWDHVPARPMRSRLALAAMTGQMLARHGRLPRRLLEGREGMDLDEMELRRRMAYHREMIALAGTPRHYEKHGLVKRHGTPLGPTSFDPASSPDSASTVPASSSSAPALSASHG